MKKLVVATTVLAALGLMNVANAAEQHTVTLGYAQTKIQDFDGIKPKGVNVKYRYEWDAPVSIISSFTYTSAKDSYTTDWDKYYYSKGDVKIQSYSLTVGPAYRVNDFFSAYALVGMNYTKVEDNGNDWDGSYADPEYMGDYGASKSSANFAYGLGLQINPITNIAIDLAYERSQAKDALNEKYTINTFNIGAGYRF